jgi:YD repeat-containing protein
MIGEGFSLSFDFYSERTYTDCADDPGGAVSGDFDNCWAGQVVTMNLDGRSTQLVLDDGTTGWHEADDAGDEVRYLTGTSANTGNGTYDNGYWEVISPNGTQYFFGKNKGPGWGGNDPQTDSAFTEPVYGPNPGDPCHSDSGFAASACTQAWRWNLDFVIDPNGNAAAYYYTPETNYYGADKSTTGVQYDRGGYLSEIDYDGTSYVPVDRYALGQGFPTTGDPELILNSITRTGSNGSGSPITLPAVVLSYQLMDSRIPGYNGQPAMSHWRLFTIQTETDETIMVHYSSECTLAQIPADPSTNTSMCYPVLWTPSGDTSPILDYFNKYLVSSVELSDGTGTEVHQVTSYNYVGNPAWHYDDNAAVKPKYRTYGEFRGFAEVESMVGNPGNSTNGTDDVQTQTATRFFRGMNGDTLPGGGVSTGVTVSDSNGVTYPDDNALAGQTRETQTFNGVGGPEISASISVPSVVATNASQARTGLPALKASMVRTIKQTDYTDLASGTPLTKTTKTTYDGFGRAILVDQSGTSIPETCSETTYDDNTDQDVWIRSAVSEVIISQQACPATVGNLTSTDVISDTRTFYDGKTSLTTAPTAGNPTLINSATTNSGGSLGFFTQKTMTYDPSGRLSTSTDADGNTTTRTYTPADGGPMTSVQTKNVVSSTQTLIATQTFDPGRGSLLTSTDAAGYLTSASYDALGRLTAVWKPGRTQGTDTANVTYAYHVVTGDPLAVTTGTLVDYGNGTNYVNSVSIYDSLGELRQTQTAAEGGDTVVTDKFYDSHGWVWQSNNKYVVAGSPSIAPVTVAESAVNDRTINTFDAAGRVVDSQNYNGVTLTDSLHRVYGGNQYASAPTVTGSVITGGSPQTTTMSYNAAGNETQIKDPAGNTWSYTYDLLGRQTKAVDPDAGTTTTGYDPAGNVAFTTDANGTSDNFSYDALTARPPSTPGRPLRATVPRSRPGPGTR